MLYVFFVVIVVFNMMLAIVLRSYVLCVFVIIETFRVSRSYLWLGLRVRVSVLVLGLGLSVRVSVRGV